MLRGLTIFTGLLGVVLLGTLVVLQVQRSLDDDAATSEDIEAGENLIDEELDLGEPEPLVADEPITSLQTEPAVPFLWTAFSDKNVLQRSPNKVTGMTKKQRLLVADDAYRAEIAAIDASVPGAAKPAPAASATRSVGSTAGKSVTTKSQRSAALNSKAYKSSTSSVRISSGSV